MEGTRQDTDVIHVKIDTGTLEDTGLGARWGISRGHYSLEV
jgi:hypothetical protein